MERELRRHQNRLMVSGSGVILFGVWSVVKMLLFFVLERKRVLAFLEDAMGDSADVGGGLTRALIEAIAFIFLFILVLILTIIALLVRLYLGISARKEGMGEKRGIAYVIVATLVLLFYIYSELYTLTHLGAPTDAMTSMTDRVTALIVDFTAIVVLWELVISAIRVKKLKKQLEG